MLQYTLQTSEVDVETIKLRSRVISNRRGGAGAVLPLMLWRRRRRRLLLLLLRLLLSHVLQVAVYFLQHGTQCLFQLLAEAAAVLLHEHAQPCTAWAIHP